LIFLHAQDAAISRQVVRAELGTLLVAGRAMDFAARLRGHGTGLTGQLAEAYAMHAGVSALELRAQALPALAAADVIVYTMTGRGIAHIEEYVGLSAPVIVQAVRVLDQLRPGITELAVLHSVEIASWAPLTASQHRQQVVKRGFDDQTADRATRLGLAAGVNSKVRSTDLGEDVVYNPNVWGAKHLEIASFLRSLPPAERDALLGMCEQASTRPSLAISHYAGYDARVLQSARKVGLLQAATVKSSRPGTTPQTYLFSPLMEIVDQALATTEALHQRKLFVAHILYGYEKATAGGGQIRDPVVLVDALLRRGVVGPASNIATDYHLVEAAGILAVEEVGGGRALLKLVKLEIVEGGLGWLEQALSSTRTGSVVDLAQLRPPTEFITPERDRVQLPADLAEADEITTSAVLKLREARKEAQRAARFDY